MALWGNKKQILILNVKQRIDFWYKLFLSLFSNLISIIIKKTKTIYCEFLKQNEKQQKQS